MVNIAQEIIDTVKAIRSDDVETNWCVIGYEGQKDLKLIGSGADEQKENVEKATALFEEGKCFYAFIRKEHQFDQTAKTIKFVYIKWLSTSVKPLRKARLTTHTSTIEKLFDPFHCSIIAEDKDECTEAVVMKEIGFGAGTAVFEVSNEDKKKRTVYNRSRIAHKDKIPAKKSTGRSWKGGNFHNAGSVLKMADQEAFDAAVGELRNDESKVDWVLITYKNNKTLDLVGKGEGGADEMKEHFEEKQVMYGLVRFIERNEQYNVDNVKFALVKLLTNKVPIVKKGRVSTHMGAIKKIYGVVHIELVVDSIENFSMQSIKDKSGKFSGAKSSVLQGKVLQKKKVERKRKATFLAPTTSGVKLNIEGEEKVREVIKDVHEDESPLCWAALRYGKDRTLTMLGSGEGGVDEMLAVFDKSTINFGIVRLEEQIDQSTLIKFCLIKFQPEKTHTMVKASVSTIKGDVEALFKPYHANIETNTIEEITQESVEKISKKK